MTSNPHHGSSLDAFLAEEGIEQQAADTAAKRVAAWQAQTRPSSNGVSDAAPDAIRTILLDYLDGRLSATEAADLIGPGTAVADVIQLAKREFGRVCDPQGPFVEAEYQRARALLGLTGPSSRHK